MPSEGDTIRPVVSEEGEVVSSKQVKYDALIDFDARDPYQTKTADYTG